AKNSTARSRNGYRPSGARASCAPLLASVTVLTYSTAEDLPEMPRPYQGALIGFGFIAEKGHVPAYLAAPDAFEIVAIAEICAARREKAKQVLPKARIHSDTKTLLSADARRLGFVDIASSPCNHA